MMVLSIFGMLLGVAASTFLFSLPSLAARRYAEKIDRLREKKARAMMAHEVFPELLE